MTAVLVLVYASVSLIVPKKPYAALLAAAILSFEPTTFAFTSIINNDPLLIFIVSVHLYTAVHILTTGKFRFRDWIILAATSVLAILTRLNGWVLLPLTGVVFLLALRNQLWLQLSTQARRRLLIGIGLLLFSIVGIAVINLVTTGSLFGRYRSLDASLLAAFPNLSLKTALTVGGAMLQQTTVTSYLSPLQFIGHPRLIEAFGWFSLLVVGIACFGIILRGRHGNRSVVLALVASIVLTTLLVFVRNAPYAGETTSASTTLIYAPLRYYSPALPAVAVLLALGLTQIRFAPWLGGLLVASWVGILVLGRSPAPEQPVLLDAANSGTIAALDKAENVGSEYPQVIGYQYQVDANASLLDLRLVTATDQALTLSYGARIDFTAPTGYKTSCQFQLANGLYSTLLWQVGDKVQTETRIPNCTVDLPRQTRVELRWVAREVKSPPIPLGQLDQALPRSPSCPPLLGVIDGNLLVTQYTASPSAHAGDLYLPSVNWYVQSKPRGLTRIYTFKGARTEYTCEGQPRLDSYPFSDWSPGETVYFDECRFHVPQDAPPGTYHVLVGVKDAQGNWLPAADEGGLLLAVPSIEVATVEFIQ